MKFSKYLICLSLMFFLNCSYIHATENNDIMQINNIENNEVSEQKEKFKKEVLDLVEELRIDIVSIDEQVEKLRKTDEYNTYPTIRLNIDTPIFGIKSIINRKLKITNEISPKEVAKGYSIRDIVKNKIVKVPDVKVGNIVISTKDINIEAELEISEYNTLVLKLMNYKEKVENVETFLNAHTNKIFKEYVSKDKKEKLDDLSMKLEKINDELLKQNEVLAKIYFVNNDSYSKLEEEYIELVSLQKKLNVNSSNVLIDNNKLNEIQKEVLSLEASVIDYVTELENASKTDLNEINIEDIYLKAYKDLNSKLNYIEDYNEKSSKEEVEKKELEDTEKVEDSDKENKTEEDNITKIVVLYEVFSNKSVNSMKEVITALEKRMDELEIKYKEDNKDLVVEDHTKNVDEKSSDIEATEKNEYKLLTNEQIETELNDIIKKYNEFLKYEYTYYLDNINGLLKATNTKVKNIATVTETDILEEAKYVYLDLPINLEKYLDSYNVNSNIEIKYLITNFKNELDKLCKNYLELVEIYEKLNVEQLLNKA